MCAGFVFLQHLKLKVQHVAIHEFFLDTMFLMKAKPMDDPLVVARTMTIVDES
jgi:hypothetical protein